MNVFFPYHLAAYVVFIDWPQVWLRVTNTETFQKLFKKRADLVQKRVRIKLCSEPAGECDLGRLAFNPADSMLESREASILAALWSRCYAGAH